MRTTLCTLIAACLLLGSHTAPSAGEIRKRGSLKTVPGSHRWEHWWSHDRELYLEAHRIQRVDARRSLAEVVRGAYATAALRDFNSPTDRKATVKALTIAVGDRSAAVRAAAIASLGRLRVLPMADRLRTILRKDRSHKVQEATLLALGMLGRQTDLERLSKVASDRRMDRRQRAAASIALGFHGTEESARLLVDLLFGGGGDGKPTRGIADDPKQRYVAVAAATALGLTDATTARAAIGRELLRKGIDPAIRARLISAAVRLGVPRSADAIAQLAEDPDRHIRRAAVAALGVLAPRADKRMTSLLIARMASDEDAAVRGLGAISLGLLGGDTASAHLKAVFTTADMRVRPYVSIALALVDRTDMVTPITTRLVDGSDPSRHAAHALALGLMGASGSATELAGVATFTGCPHQRGVTCLALGLVKEAKAFDTVLGLLEKTPDRGPRIHAAYALALLDRARALKELTRVLETEGNPSHRRQAALALGSLRYDDAVAALSKALANRRLPHDVRAAAAVALGRAAESERIGAHARLTIGIHDRLDDDPLAHLPKVL